MPAAQQVPGAGPCAEQVWPLLLRQALSPFRPSCSLPRPPSVKGCPPPFWFLRLPFLCAGLASHSRAHATRTLTLLGLRSWDTTWAEYCPGTLTLCEEISCSGLSLLPSGCSAPGLCAHFHSECLASGKFLNLCGASVFSSAKWENVTRLWVEGRGSVLTCENCSVANPPGCSAQR